MRKFIFYLIMLMPTVLIVVLPSYYAIFFTNIPQTLYIDSVRNIFVDCFEIVADDYVYKMKSGPCPYRNIEYDVTTLSDASGFRKSEAVNEPQVAVIGDSHAYGFGVNDDQTFAHLLEAKYGYSTLNLGIASYATARELEALRKYGQDAKYVVLQYCDNDRGENENFLKLSREQFRASVETGWRAFINHYREGKARGLLKPIEQLGVILGSQSFERKAAWRKRINDAREVGVEAALFARIVTAYQSVLAGRRLIILDSSGWGINPPSFKAAFSLELAKLPWLEYRVLDTATLLSEADYYFFDDHLRPEGHRKLAADIAREIADWQHQDKH